MKIQNITFEMGNDFSAIMSCEHCGATHKLTSGYHDNYYHTQVIPAMACPKCFKNRAGIDPYDSERHRDIEHEIEEKYGDNVKMRRD